MSNGDTHNDSKRRAVLLSQAETVRKHILSFDPPHFMAEFVNDVHDLYAERNWVRDFHPSDNLLSSVVEIVYRAVVTNQRFRTEPCLRVVKSLVKRRRELNDVPQRVVDQLFEIYKRYVNCGREDIEWCVSVFIKDSILRDDQIRWLVDNWVISSHVVNRLLMYPMDSPIIRSWARQVIAANQLQDRRSELLALLMDEDILNKVDDDPTTKLWAICKSRIPLDDKIMYMQQYATLEAFDATINVALRIGDPRPLQTLLARIEEESANKDIEPAC